VQPSLFTTALEPYADLARHVETNTVHLRFPASKQAIFNGLDPPIPDVNQNLKEKFAFCVCRKILTDDRLQPAVLSDTWQRVQEAVED
jgi:hypothetical protein